MSYRKDLQMVINGRYQINSAVINRVYYQSDANSSNNAQPQQWINANDAANIPAQGDTWLLNVGTITWQIVAESTQFVPPFACRLTKIAWTIHYENIAPDVAGITIGLFAATVPDTPPEDGDIAADTSTSAIRCVGVAETADPTNSSGTDGLISDGYAWITGSGRDIAAGEACFMGVESTGPGDADYMNVIFTLTFEII